MDLHRKRYTTELFGTPIVLELSDLAGKASGSVIGHYGDTSVIAAVVLGRETQSDFFPLSVEYEERFYAAGKVIGSRVVRREGRPSEEAVLSGRLIDRTIRPLFPKDFRREVQVTITVLAVSYTHLTLPTTPYV